MCLLFHKNLKKLPEIFLQCMQNLTSLYYTNIPPISIIKWHQILSEAAQKKVLLHTGHWFITKFWQLISWSVMKYFNFFFMCQKPKKIDGSKKSYEFLKFAKNQTTFGHIFQILKFWNFFSVSSKGPMDGTKLS